MERPRYLSAITACRGAVAVAAARIQQAGLLQLGPAAAAAVPAGLLRQSCPGCAAGCIDCHAHTLGYSALSTRTLPLGQRARGRARAGLRNLPARSDSARRFRESEPRPRTRGAGSRRCAHPRQSCAADVADLEEAREAAEAEGREGREGQSTLGPATTLPWHQGTRASCIRSSRKSPLTFMYCGFGHRRGVLPSA